MAVAAEVELPAAVDFTTGQSLKRLLVLDGLQDPGNVVETTPPPPPPPSARLGLIICRHHLRTVCLTGTSQ